MNQELKDRIEDVRANILLEQPFYGTILSHIPLVEDESIDTAATDGRRIIYSPEYMGLLKGSEIKFTFSLCSRRSMKLTSWKA